MTYYKKLCGQSICVQSRSKHFISITHKTHDNSIVRRYNILIPNFDEIDATMKEYVNENNKEYEEIDVPSLFKLLTSTNRIRYIRMKPESSLHYSFYVLEKKLLLGRINQDRYYFSQVLEMRISFVSCIRSLTYNHCLKQPKPMGEMKVNEILAKNPQLINAVDRTNNHPLIRKYSIIPITNQ